VARAGKTMEEIVNSIQGVTTTITQITSASFEQTSGIQQVNQAIGQMDDVTQQNAALVEQAAASAEALEEQARKLSVTMENFKIADSASKPNVAPVLKTYTPSAPIQKTTPVVMSEAIEAIDIDLDGALKKHLDWKIKLRTAISNRETLDVATISKDNCCDFGKWLHHEDTHPQISHLSSYRECVEHHALFHVECGKIAEVINEKKYDQAEKLLGSVSGFSNASSAVGAAIMRLKKDTAAKPAAVVKPASVVKPVKSKVVDASSFADDWEEF
ncbi:MAG: CZB domain-containing protein, partial [Methylococcales bacterium]|nr:CZB domain-containing protein [Methylococcales bacterium]